ncbi:HNH endonuclease [Fodinicurvata fenggangensis]|uniref:HNH endonuclease n=1 Tax=Fodinicurvata fenggangensis TaxID=1121830 RepID=UPI00047E04C3|nr:HNH endonuclease [Fodinicurvata fenggangensis]
MGYSVFIHRADSIYDDRPDERYQFPRQYLGRAKESINDWIVYLEPSKVPGTRGYFAIARVQEIIEDPKAPNMYLALIEPGSYLEFANGVEFSDQDGPVERGLLNEHGRLSGRAQSAVRPISPEDFLRILEHGLKDAVPTLPRIDAHSIPFWLGEGQAPSEFAARERVQQFTNRAVRDRVFRKIVIRAYDERCAITDLKFINGGGRAEVDAAHIQPVQHNGPDIVNNGIALSGTAHWMFDRGLISLSDDFDILISRQVNDIDSVRSFIRKSGRAALPLRSSDRPHARFLKWHRENCFKH